MPSPRAHDPAWQAYRHVVKVRFTSNQLGRIDQMSAEHGVSRSWLIRAALSEGLPLLFDVLAAGRAGGLSARAARTDGRPGDRYRGRSRETLLPLVLAVDDAPGARVDHRGVAFSPEEDG